MVGILPTPSPLKNESRADELKSRLDWGEPALTIVDIRDRDAFNVSRIMGAISMPMAELVELALANFESERDIYVYGDTNEQAATAAERLRVAGFENVSELIGGLPAWKAFGYQTEDSLIAA
ncbi:MAG: rhodanese-like domain-containing protein [Cyanobacteria bacterium P01_H01_bin.121]